MRIYTSLSEKNLKILRRCFLEMDVKKFYLLVLSFIICILSISAINATEDIENEDVISVDNNLETNVLSDDVSDSEKNSEIILKENDNDGDGPFIERSHYRSTEIYMGNITNHSSTDFHIPISELLKNN